MALGNRRQSLAVFNRMKRHQPDSILRGTYRNYYVSDTVVPQDGEEYPYRDIPGREFLRTGRLRQDTDLGQVITQLDVLFVPLADLVYGEDNTVVAVTPKTDRIIEQSGAQWIVNEAILTNDGALWEIHVYRV